MPLSESSPRALARRGALLLLTAAPLLSGCFAGSFRLDEQTSTEGVSVTVDANATAVRPGRRVKYWVEIENQSLRDLLVDRVSIELRVSPRHDPETITLRRTWNFEWAEPLVVESDRKLTIPIVPRVQEIVSGRQPHGMKLDQSALVVSEFGVDQLIEGEYEVRALVNERHLSSPYALRVDRGGTSTLDVLSSGRR